jgi:predicted DCC family thiol-disulfide oxidoreductase YuxK
MLVWDGDCTFCKFWVTRWKILSGDAIDFKTYQEVASKFEDLPLKEFKKASRFIDLDGQIYSGPDSAYKSYTFSKALSSPWHTWYRKYPFFRWLSDNGYNFIAKHRSAFYKITVAFFGKNPEKLKPYWLFYAVGLFAICFGIFWIL